MKLYSEHTAGLLYVRLNGELDHHSADRARLEIERDLDRYLPRSCALDLSRLTFMDSSGIALILYISKRMTEINGDFWLVRPSAQPEKVLRASGIERLVSIKTVQKEAIR